MNTAFSVVALFVLSGALSAGLAACDKETFEEVTVRNDSDFATIQAATRIIADRLDGNSMSKLASAKQVTFLQLEGCSLSADATAIVAALPKLSHLGVISCINVTAASMAPLAASGIASIELRSRPDGISEGLANVLNDIDTLQRVTVETYGEHTAQSMASLAGIGKLRVIRLYEAYRVQSTELSKLALRADTIEELKIDNALTTDHYAIIEIGKLVKLRKLAVYAGQLQSKSIRSLLDCTALEDLELVSAKHLTDDDIKTLLDNLRSLSRLDVSGSDVTGSFLAAKGASHLDGLWLSRVPKLDIQHLSVLAKHGRITELHLSDESIATDATCGIISEIESLTMIHFPAAPLITLAGIKKLLSIENLKTLGACHAEKLTVADLEWLESYMLTRPNLQLIVKRGS